MTTKTKAKAKTKTKAKTKGEMEAERMLTGNECSDLCEALFRVIKNPDADAPSELIELVDKVILYVETLDDQEGGTTPGLGELIDARAEYDGPGIIQMAR